MNTNGTNSGMNIEDYEDLAVRKSNVAKKVAIGAGVAVGGAAVVGGTAYAATNMFGHDDVTEDPLTADDLVEGAEVAEDFKPVEETQETSHVVYVEKPAAPAPEPDASDEIEVTWDETTNYNVDGETLMTVEEGTVDGHHFALADVDGDGHADVLGIDMNDNGQFEENELQYYSYDDHVHMGHETAHTHDINYMGGAGGQENEQYLAYEDEYRGQGQDIIHNNFEDEKTGEEYHGDYAENNPDYNPRADIDYGHNEYLAEDHHYDGDQEYHAGVSDEYNTGYQEDYHADYHEDDDHLVDPAYDDHMANMEDNHDDFDTMMENDEFMG